MSMSMYGIVVLGLVLAFLTFLGTALYRALAIKINLIDYPNDRSSHRIPTPSGAGLVFVGLTVGCIYLVISPTHGDWSKLSLLLTFSAVALLGSLDDGFGLPVVLRLLLQILFVLGTITSINEMLDVHSFWSHTHSIRFLQYGFVLACMLWLLNLYNFMDGIDGLATTEAIFIAAVSGGFLYWSGNVELAFWMLILVSTLAGFLYWNLSPAKVFMGDAGSSFLGFFFGAVALSSIIAGDLSFSFWLIVCAIFISDSTLTLCYRLMGGENIFQAHRTHAYQHATVRLGGHAPVVKYCAVINVCWLLPLACLSYIYTDIAHWIAVCAYVPIMVTCIKFNAGRVVPIATDSL